MMLAVNPLPAIHLYPRPMTLNEQASSFLRDLDFLYICYRALTEQSDDTTLLLMADVLEDSSKPFPVTVVWSGEFYGSSQRDTLPSTP